MSLKWFRITFQYKLADSPEPSDAEEEDSEDEDDGFGPAKKEDDDPVARKEKQHRIFDHFNTNTVEAKALAEQAMSDPLGAATKSLDKVKFW